jgi:hypothetical protein
MCLVYSHRGEATLEQMSRPAATSVDEIGVTSVHFPNSTTPVGGLLRLHNQIYVVGHQAVGPHLGTSLAHLLG